MAALTSFRALTEKYDREISRLILGEKLTYEIESMMPCGHLRGRCSPTECWRQPRCYLCSKPTQGLHAWIADATVKVCHECRRRYL